jgi:hypothetical protein
MNWNPFESEIYFFLYTIHTFHDKTKFIKLHAITNELKSIRIWNSQKNTFLFTHLSIKRHWKKIFNFQRLSIFSAALTAC